MTRQPEPLRIKQLTLTDFRAFPGPAPAHFDLDGKNLLVYGEVTGHSRPLLTDPLQV